MVVRGLCARVGVTLAAGLAVLAFAAPLADAHPEECLSGAAAWATVIPWTEAEFTGGDGTCTPASVAARYDTSGATLGPGETDGRNLRLVANLPKIGSHAGLSNANSDLAFSGKYAIQGNYAGFQITDISDPSSAPDREPGPLSRLTERRLGLEEPPLPVHGQQPQRRQLRERDEAGDGPDRVGGHQGLRHLRRGQPALHQVGGDGLRLAHPHAGAGRRPRAALRVVVHPRPDRGSPDCQPPHDKISIVEVPLDAPTTASVIAEPVLFPDGGYAGTNNYTAQTTGCHDITVYRAHDLAAGACMGDGILMDISDPAKPKVLARMFDPNFAFWHSATISHDARQVLFTDERGGGVGAECNPTVGPQRGADAVYNIRRRDRPAFMSYFKIPRDPDGDGELRGAQRQPAADRGPRHPRPGLVPGRHLRDRLDQREPDRRARVVGPRAVLDESGNPALAGSWSSYWYNGRIYSNEIQRGFDVIRFTGLASLLSLVTPRLPYVNAQTQEPPRRWW